MDAADTDDSGGPRQNITDAIGIFNWLFLGKAPPRPPTPSKANNYPSVDCSTEAFDPNDLMDCKFTAPVCQ